MIIDNTKSRQKILNSTYEGNEENNEIKEIIEERSKRREAMATNRAKRYKNRYKSRLGKQSNIEPQENNEVKRPKSTINGYNPIAFPSNGDDFNPSKICIKERKSKKFQADMIKINPIHEEQKNVNNTSKNDDWHNGVTIIDPSQFDKPILLNKIPTLTPSCINYNVTL